ncbi:MAG: penicillin acylase family protein [Candidatus Eremiobacteraeota bacterium]|nr:penicillin acylase family protein [Candidatus Eremiobacteraeota bacterium]
MVVLLVGLYAARVAMAGHFAVARVDGTVGQVPVDGPVTIARDQRGVPHIRAGSVHDLFVAEGFAMASDRLFQMDLTRRYVDGRLAELLGSNLVRVDRRMRRYGIRELAARVFEHATADERAMLVAFADGINAAATQQPKPPEYHALFATFERWQPEDALAVGFATVLDLDDKPDDVVIRDAVRNVVGEAGLEALYPLTDPRYDVPTNGRPAGAIAKLPALGAFRQAHGDQVDDPTVAFTADDRAPVGSNAWAAGADRTTSGKAILANDPHLDIGIPGIWWLVEASAPGVHIGGGALAGTPGVTLGHNEHVAWGVTAGETAAMRVLKERRSGADMVQENGRWVHLQHHHERIEVRFGADVDLDVMQTPRGVVISDGGPNGYAYLMDWRMHRNPVSPLAPFARLLHARTAADGIAAMRDLPEPALNVLVADDAGRVAYHFAGQVPLDPSWGRWASDGDSREPAYLTFASAPHIDPSRSALVVSSNNRSDGSGSPRLAPYWPPPYRAFEIERALAASADTNGKLSPDTLAREQLDATSPAEHEFATQVLGAAARRHADRDATLAPILAAMRSFDGPLVPESRGATAVVAVRRDMLGAISAAHLPSQLANAYPATSPGFEVVLRALRERPRGWVANDDYDTFVVDSLRRVQNTLGTTIPTFGTYAAQPLKHALAPFGFSFWNGPVMPGRGGSFAPFVQWNIHAQSFRAVWTAGDWDHGTIDVAAGESGEPGSPHYADQNAKWVKFERTTLPFSDAAVRAATKSTLTLTRS